MSNISVKCLGLDNWCLLLNNQQILLIPICTLACQFFLLSDSLHWYLIMTNSNFVVKTICPFWFSQFLHFWPHKKVFSWNDQILSGVVSPLFFLIRAWNNGRSTDNVRSKIGFVRSNPWMAGQFVRSFTLVKKNSMRIFRF